MIKTSSPIRIALADDHKMFACGIESLLEDIPEFKICETFSNGVELTKFLRKNIVDVVLTDMNMPLMDGIGVISAVKHALPEVKIIVLSMYDDEEIYNKAIRLGADAYVLKGSDPDQLIDTIKKVFKGSYIPVLPSNAGNHNSNYSDNFQERFKLSKRELEILRMIKDGKLNKEIAKILCLSLHTVEAHRKHIHQKLGVSSAVELVKKALEMKV